MRESRLPRTRPREGRGRGLGEGVGSVTPYRGRRQAPRIRACVRAYTRAVSFFLPGRNLEGFVWISRYLVLSPVFALGYWNLNRYSRWIWSL